MKYVEGISIVSPKVCGFHSDFQNSCSLEVIPWLYHCIKKQFMSSKPAHNKTNKVREQNKQSQRALIRKNESALFSKWLLVDFYCHFLKQNTEVMLKPCSMGIWTLPRTFALRRNSQVQRQHPTCKKTCELQAHYLPRYTTLTPSVVSCMDDGSDDWYTPASGDPGESILFCLG